MKTLVQNLCIVHKDPNILLGMKKRRFGTGKWNGYGGKVLDGESIEESLHREILEEANIKILDPVKLGFLVLEYPSDDLIIENHLYKATKYEGEPVETEEMRPQWFHVDKIPFAEMWGDDPYWMKMFLEGKKFRGRFVFDKDEKVKDYELEEVLELD